MEIVRGKRFKYFLEETKKEAKERTDGPLDSFSKDLKDSIKKNVNYYNLKEENEK
tara:strand:+ start:57 stop:221 length:165 start_codon:yes stop_codon:yes gene_type:complete